MNASAYLYAALPGSLEAFTNGWINFSEYVNDTGGLTCDGNLTTGRFCSVTSNSPPQNGNGSVGVCIDMGAVTTLTGVIVKYTNNVSGGPAYYVSSNGTTWTFVTATFVSTTTNGTKYSFPSGTTGRYIQATMSAQTNAPYSFGFNEFYGFDSTGTIIGAPIPPTPPSATLAASPTTIYRGMSSLLTWTTANATSASIDQGIGGVTLNGSQSVSPTTTTTYTLTATGPGGTATATATVTVLTPPREVHIFSTGTLFATVNGVQTEFALLQEIAVRFQSKIKLLYDAPQVSKFAVDAAFYGGEASLVARYAGINVLALQTALAAASAGTNPVTLTVGQVVALAGLSAVLTLQDTTGKQYIFTFGNLRIPSLELPLAEGDFTVPNVQMSAYPDGSGNICTIQMPQ